MAGPRRYDKKRAEAKARVEGLIQRTERTPKRPPKKEKKPPVACEYCGGRKYDREHETYAMCPKQIRDERIREEQERND